MDRERQPRL